MLISSRGIGEVRLLIAQRELGAGGDSTHMERLFFYNSTNGAGAIGDLSLDGLTTVHGFPANTFPKGWTHVAELPGTGGRMLFYQAATHEAAVGELEPATFMPVKAYPPDIGAWTHLVGTLVAGHPSTLFYNAVTGAAAVGFDPPEALFPFTSGWTHVVSGRRSWRVLFYDATTGAGTLDFRPSTPTSAAGSFAAGSTHLAVGPCVEGRDSLLFYNGDTGAGTLGLLGEDGLSTVWKWSPGGLGAWTLVVGTDTGFLFYHAATGAAAVGALDGDILKLTRTYAPDGFARGWTHVIRADLPSPRPPLGDFAPSPLLGDYAPTGATTQPGNKVDPWGLMGALTTIHASDYMHLVWGNDEYRDAWNDFEPLAAQCQAAGMRLWLYLTTPSEEPEPYPIGFNYVTWAIECAKVAANYPNVAGICIDDFCSNLSNTPPEPSFTPDYCKQMMDEARAIAPNMKLLVVAYWDQMGSLAKHLESDVIDGVVFPYIRPHYDHTTTDTLMPQIEEFRTSLNKLTNSAGLCRRVSLVVMVYAQSYSLVTSLHRSPPTPDYVKACLRIGLDATRRGLADGVVTYCLPKSERTFVEAVAEVYETVL